MSNTFYVFRKMIIYHKSKNMRFTWRVFEYAIFLSLALVFVHFDYSDTFFKGFIILFFIFGLLLSMNQTWLVYLTINKKLKGMLMLFLVLIVSSLFAFFIYEQSIEYGSLSIHNEQVIDIIHDVPIVSLFVFIITYSLSSILIIIFTLPVSSAFEKRIKETNNFQQLNEILKLSSNEETIYPLLLNTSSEITKSTSSWLQITTPNDIRILSNNSTELEIQNVTNFLQTLDNTQQHVISTDNIDKSQILTFSKKKIRSILYLPLIYNKEKLGHLVLTRDLYGAFDKELIKSVSIYADQAVSTILNFRLLKEALHNQRFIEEKNIAKAAKKALIATSIPKTDQLEITIESRSSGDVGGDYVDFCSLQGGTYLAIIADVSGSGIKAAFHMAQLKGVLKTLIHTFSNLTSFIYELNTILNEILPKTSFITLSALVIDTNTKTFDHIRAGHCSPIYISGEEIKELKDKGIGLGMVKADKFNNKVEKVSYSYKSGDILLLYTDGITETKNEIREEYGTEKLMKFIYTNQSLSTKEITSNLFENVSTFSNKESETDDSSCITIRFI
ncbi:MAG: GAF domain-containing SpoIIE family protein phosphatase [Cyclobacteriaceae bacterium]